MKRHVYVILLVVLCCFGLYRAQRSTSEASTAPYQKLQGSVFHTFYHISYQGEKNYSHEIDSLFKVFDGSLQYIVDVLTPIELNHLTILTHYFSCERF